MCGGDVWGGGGYGEVGDMGEEGDGGGCVGRWGIWVGRWGWGRWVGRWVEVGGEVGYEMVGSFGTLKQCDLPVQDIQR